MNPQNPTPNSNQPKPPKKVFDVVRPGKTLASPNSRSVVGAAIVGHSSQVPDDQFVSVAHGKPAATPEQRPLMDGSRKVVISPRSLWADARDEPALTQKPTAQTAPAPVAAAVPAPPPVPVRAPQHAKSIHVAPKTAPVLSRTAQRQATAGLHKKAQPTPVTDPLPAASGLLDPSEMPIAAPVSTPAVPKTKATPATARPAAAAATPTAPVATPQPQLARPENRPLAIPLAPDSADDSADDQQAASSPQLVGIPSRADTEPTDADDPLLQAPTDDAIPAIMSQDELLSQTTAPRLDDRVGVVSHHHHTLRWWHYVLIFLAIVLLAAVAFNFLLDAGFVEMEGIPHTEIIE